MEIKVPARGTFKRLRMLCEGKTAIEPTHITSEQAKTLTRPEIAFLCNELFMANYRGVPCQICGRTRFGRSPSVAHHLLPKSTYPHLRYTKENTIVLCVPHHDWAERCPESFTELLKNRFPDVYEWYIWNKHHLDDHKLDLLEIFEQLKEQN